MAVTRRPPSAMYSFGNIWGFERLEPEIKAVIVHQEVDRHVHSVDAGLKEIKKQLQNEHDHLPDIRSFLNEHRHTASAMVKTETFFHALDATVCFVIRTLKERMSPKDLRHHVTTTVNADVSLLAMVMEFTLVNSCALLLSYGAASDLYGTHPERLMEELRVFMSKSPLEISRSKELATIRDLLDFRAFCIGTAEPYYVTKTTRLGNNEPFVFTNGQFDQLPSHDADEKETQWIHIPSTNGLAICAILQAVRPEFVPGFRDHFSVPTAVPGDPLLDYREVGYWSGSVLDIKTYNANPGPVFGKTIGYTVIVFPCLRLTTIGNHRSNRSEYEKLRKSLSTKVSGKYSSECTYHLERTLDEAYYPGLDAHVLEARNNDQIVSSEAKSSTAIAEDNFPILIVPQLWLWEFDNVVISAYRFTEESDCFATQEHAGSDRKLNLWRREHISSDSDLRLEMGRTMASCIEAFGTNVTLGKTNYPPTLDLFERRVVAVLSEVNSYMENGKRNEIDYDVERSFHHTLSDVRGELVMIQHILREQRDVLERLLGGKQQSEYAAGWAPVLKAVMTLERYQEWTRKIDNDAERIEKNVQDMLNLKRTYASVQDSHVGVLLSIAAIGFAIVTIVFAPLAFLAALFALNLEAFSKLRVKQSVTENRDLTVKVDVSNNNPAYDSGKMASIFIGTELLTIAVTCLLVWISLRWFGVDFGDFRMNRDRKPRDKQTKKGMRVTTGSDAKERKINESDNEATRDEVTTRWFSSLTRRKKTAQSKKDHHGV